MSVVPTVLEFTVSGAFSPTFGVELADGVLRCGIAQEVVVPDELVRDESASEGRGRQTTWESLDAELRPTQEQWVEFRERLDAMGAFDWQESYEDLSVLDGWRWSLRVEYSDVRVTSGGYNSYPDSDGVPTDSRNQGFRSLVRAMHGLTGCDRIVQIAFDG